MITIIQRTTDKKYVQSFENDVWVENIKEAYEFSFLESQKIKETLLIGYDLEQLKEIPNFTKSKPVSKSDVKELRTLFPKRNLLT